MLTIKDSFKPHSGAGAFFFSILLWGIGIGSFAAALNNYLSDIYHMDSMERGWLEFFRELPGLALVLILALLHKVSDWKVIRIGTMISMAGAALLLIPANQIAVTAFIMIWSMGEHLVMPSRAAVAMQVAKQGCAGQSLGLLTSVMNFGHVAGSLLVAGIFFVGTRCFERSEAFLFNVLWGVIIVLMLVSTISTFSKDAPDAPGKRPRLYFNRKFNKFYALELFYGARKQIFITFAPFVLIKEYGFSTASMATLLGLCALINVFAAPAIGKLTDKWGYRNTMISMAGAALLLIPANQIAVTAFIMIWSMGEHLVMPSRAAVAMQVAKPGCAGQSLGFLTSVMNFGHVAGSLLVAGIFFFGTRYFERSEAFLFNVLWCVIIVLMLASTISTFTLVAITNLPPRKMMGRESCGMLLSAVHTEKGEEKLNLIMLDDKIPAGAKMC